MDWQNPNSKRITGGIVEYNDTIVEKILSLQSENDELHKQLNDYKELINKDRNEINILRKEIEDISTDINGDNTSNNIGLTNDIKLLKDDIKTVRNKTLEPLAIFVSFFTFISVGFGVFQNIKDPNMVVVLLFILAGASVIFSGLIVHTGSLVSDDNKRRNWTAWLLGIGVFMFAIGFFVYWSSSDYIESNYVLQNSHDPSNNNAEIK